MKKIYLIIIISLWMILPQISNAWEIYGDVSANVQTLINAKADLAGGNAFTGNQTVDGSITASGITVSNRGHAGLLGLTDSYDLPPKINGNGLLLINSVLSSRTTVGSTTTVNKVSDGSITHTYLWENYYSDGSYDSVLGTYNYAADSFAITDTASAGFTSTRTLVTNVTRGVVLRNTFTVSQSDGGGTYWLNYLKKNITSAQRDGNWRSGVWMYFPATMGVGNGAGYQELSFYVGEQPSVGSINEFVSMGNKYLTDGTPVAGLLLTENSTGTKPAHHNTAVVGTSDYTGAWHYYEIECPDSTDVHFNFYVDGVKVADETDFSGDAPDAPNTWSTQQSMVGFFGLDSSDASNTTYSGTINWLIDGVHILDLP